MLLTVSLRHASFQGVSQQMCHSSSEPRRGADFIFRPKTTSPAGRKLWMARWKSARSGGQHGHRCGYLVDSERIFKSLPGNPCATGVPGSRIRHCRRRAPRRGNAGTQEEPGNRNFTRVPGTSSRSINQKPAGQPAGQRPKTGPGPCISYMQGPGLFPRPNHPQTGLFPGATGQVCAVCHAAEPFLLYSVPSVAMPRCRRSYSVPSARTADRVMPFTAWVMCSSSCSAALVQQPLPSSALMVG